MAENAKISTDAKMKADLFKMVEDYVQANYNKPIMVVDPNTMPQGYVLAYSPGNREPYKVTREELEKFMQAKAVDKKPE